MSRTRALALAALALLALPWLTKAVLSWRSNSPLSRESFCDQLTVELAQPCLSGWRESGRKINASETSPSQFEIGALDRPLLVTDGKSKGLRRLVKRGESVSFICDRPDDRI